MAAAAEGVLVLVVLWMDTVIAAKLQIVSGVALADLAAREANSTNSTTRRTGVREFVGKATDLITRLPDLEQEGRHFLGAVLLQDESVTEHAREAWIVSVDARVRKQLVHLAGLTQLG